MAVVNGEPIPLRLMQTLLDSRSAAMGTLRQISLESMQLQYGDALGVLIVHALVRQELERRQIPVPEMSLAEAVRSASGDYDDKDLAKFLEDACLPEADWLALLRDHFALRIFERQVLLPGMIIELDEIKEYYERNKKFFHLPERLDVCFVSADEQEALDRYCADPPSKGNEPADVRALCRTLAVDDLPPQWSKEVAALEIGACSGKKRQGESWLAVALTDRQTARHMNAVEAYPVIESMLFEEKKKAAFDIWLEKRLARATIRISPILGKILSSRAVGDDIQTKK